MEEKKTEAGGTDRVTKIINTVSLTFLSLLTTFIWNIRSEFSEERQKTKEMQTTLIKFQEEIKTQMDKMDEKIERTNHGVIDLKIHNAATDSKLDNLEKKIR